MSKIYLISLGCDKNRIDGEVMIGTLRNAGHKVIDDPTQAEGIIVNTCGFIRDAVQESIDMVLELASYKQEGNCRALIVVGCMAERYRQEIKDTIPEADAIIGVGEYGDIARVVEGLLGIPSLALSESASASADGLQAVSGAASVIADNEGMSDPYLSRLAARHDDAIPHVAYVKISEGCDNHCTYCTIPSIRGAYRSRRMESILEECRLLVNAGARELVLVAQDTALYGTDIYGEKKLPELLGKIAAESSAVWIRLMYAYPEHITPELIKTMAALPQICKYIDMPIQHSEDSILSRMGRSGSKAELKNLIRNMREKIPGIAIRTTIMVGFPGETAENYKSLYSFVREVKFDRLGVFPYSREEGTPAAKMPKQVKDEVKQSRLNRLMILQQKIHFAKQKSYIGQTLAVMVDNQYQPTDSEASALDTIRADIENPENGFNGVPSTYMYTGRTQNDAYEVDATVHFSSPEPLAAGQICKVTILGANEYDLLGMS